MAKIFIALVAFTIIAGYYLGNALDKVISEKQQSNKQQIESILNQ